MTRKLALGIVAFAAVACGGSTPAASSFGSPDAGTTTTGTPSGSDDAGTTTGGPTFDGSIGGTSLDASTTTPQVAVVYGESPDTLYSLDPTTKAVTVVGTFSGCSSVEDIALDKDSNMYGTTSSALYKIDRKTAVCTLVAKGSYPNSLSFVPAGTLDPSVEALVGYNGASYIRIDPASGVITTVGSIGSGDLQSSGDIVSVKGGSTYLTVKGTNCNTNDCLIEVNPATGAMVKNWGSINHNAVFGLSFWAGSLFGFDDGGDLFEVDLTNGVLSTTTIPVPNPPAGLEFWGAGSTTSAPVSPPPK